MKYIVQISFVLLKPVLGVTYLTRIVLSNGFTQWPGPTYIYRYGEILLTIICFLVMYFKHLAKSYIAYGSKSLLGTYYNEWEWEVVIRVTLLDCSDSHFSSLEHSSHGFDYEYVFRSQNAESILPLNFYQLDSINLCDCACTHRCYQRIV